MEENSFKMKLLRNVSRIVIGLVFMFSGVVKAIDPLGSAYKFHDYFQAFHIGFLGPLSLTLAIFLCTAEFISGFSVLTGLRFRTGIWGVMILMVIFTPVTFLLALTNPVSDCGCFGDAIKLTNWQTFWKNIVIITLTLILFLNRNQAKSILSTIKEWVIISCTIVVFVIFSLYNLRYLPVIDFLPYRTGVKIAEKMVIPEGAPSDKYKTTFIYKKDKIKKEFTLDNYPAGDTAWKFVEQKSILIKKGYVPPIHDFVISNLNGEDQTMKILSNQGYSMLMISKKIAEAGSHLKKGFELGEYLKGKGIDFYVVTSSGTYEIVGFNNGLVFCTADETTIKTMLRSNPGYMLIRNGIIVGKWSWANVPEKEWFGSLMLQNPL